MGKQQEGDGREDSRNGNYGKHIKGKDNSKTERGKIGKVRKAGKGRGIVARHGGKSGNGGKSEGYLEVCRSVATLRGQVWDLEDSLLNTVAWYDYENALLKDEANDLRKELLRRNELMLQIQDDFAELTRECIHWEKEAKRLQKLDEWVMNTWL